MDPKTLDRLVMAVLALILLVMIGLAAYAANDDSARAENCRGLGGTWDGVTSSCQR